MILYLDTSALVKIYAEEPGRDEVQNAIREARVTAISSVGLVEARSALARKEREGFLSTQEHDDTLALLLRDFREIYLVRAVTESIIERAGGITRTHALRALDAVHLATALSLRDEVRELAAARQTEPTVAPLWESEECQVRLLTYDRSLTEAARQEDFV